MRFACLGVVVVACALALSADDGLADKLLAAKSDAERTTLLAGHESEIKPELLTALNDRAGDLYDKREFTRGLEVAGFICGLASQIGDRADLAECRFTEALCLSNLRRQSEADPKFREAESLYDSLQDPAALSRVLAGEGFLLQRSGNLVAALPKFERAAAEAESSGQANVIVQANVGLGNIYRMQSRYSDAIRVFQKAKDSIRPGPIADKLRAQVLNALGSTYYDENDLELAISTHLENVALRERIHAPPTDLAGATLNLGLAYQKQGDFKKATAYFDRAAQLLESGSGSGSPLQLLVTYNYGMTLHRMKQLPAAKEKLERALALAEKMGDRRLISSASIELAEVAVEEKRYEDAKSLAAPSAALGREQHDPRMLIRADDVIGVAQRMLKRYDEAEATLDEAIRTVEQARDELPGDRQGLARFMGAESSPYLHMVEMQIERGHLEAALGYAERIKGRALLDILQNGRVSVSKALSADEQAEEAGLAAAIVKANEKALQLSRRTPPDRKALADAEAEVEKARLAERSFEVALYVRHPQLRVQRVAVEPVPPAQLIALLPDPNSALLEYVITDGGKYLLVLTGARGGYELKSYPLNISRQALNAEVSRFRTQIADRDLEYRKLATELYQLLLQPAREQLRGKSTLVIVPDGALWQLPFQALMPSAGRHLLEDHAIFYVPSLTVLHEMQKLHRERTPNPRLLALAAADLPSARREVAGLRALYGQNRVTLYSAQQSDPALLKREAHDYDILHIAAHGVFEDRQPLESYLVLAKDGKAEAGVLQARDMMDLDLRADMVVLSGCETGRGEATGEGLIGMAWALFIAGSPSTVASQWKVEAESTSTLMLDFHRRLQRSGKAKALQQAALAVMQKPEFRHPFYWSGFVLMGEGF